MYVVVVSENELFRYGIRHMIFTIYSKAIVENVEQAHLPNLLRQDRPALLIIDTRSSIQKSCEICRFVQHNHPQGKIICFVETSHEDEAIPLLSSDIDGFLSFDSSTEELSQCFSYVLSGKTYYHQYISSMMHHKIAQSTRKEETLKNKYFSRREKEILLLVCQQHTSKEIGRMLEISQRTVDGYRYRLIRKCQVKNTAGLIHYAINNGLFTATAEAV